MDLTQLSDSDLLALQSGDLTKVSDAGLAVLNQGQPKSPTLRESSKYFVVPYSSP